MATPDPKAKIRNRPNPVFDSKHPKVKDNKDHFPLGNENQARNALARVNQYDSAPEWWSGNLGSLQSAVVRSVHKKYPNIEVSEKAKKSKKEEKKATLNDVFDHLIKIKTAQLDTYNGVLNTIKTKIANNESHDGWSPDNLQTLLDHLED
jgi:hypothetical protein